MIWCEYDVALYVVKVLKTSDIKFRVCAQREPEWCPCAFLEEGWKYALLKGHVYKYKTGICACYDFCI